MSKCCGWASTPWMLSPGLSVHFRDFGLCIWVLDINTVPPGNQKQKPIYWHVLGHFYKNIIKEIAGKLQGIILLHLGVMTSRFYYWNTLKPQCS